MIVTTLHEEEDKVQGEGDWRKREKRSNTYTHNPVGGVERDGLKHYGGGGGG